jgi:hypothetical protein
MGEGLFSRAIPVMMATSVIAMGLKYWLLRMLQVLFCGADAMLLVMVLIASICQKLN